MIPADGRIQPQRPKPEILSPAGNPEKLRFAVDYGADAVYCALRKFGMRGASENFTPDELVSSVEYAHSKGVRVYLTMNTMPRDDEFSLLPDFIRAAEAARTDAYIVSDPGVMDYLHRYASNPEIHLSTQTSTVNSATCLFWHRLGIKRIVLARELSLSEIRAIREQVPDTLELEAFIHGAMCVSYSGRCLLSNYFAGRNANGGCCAQPCRWKYFIHEEKRPEDILTAEQTEEGTYLFSSRDLCMIEHVPALCEAGLNALKIEGRVKSAYYTAAVTNAYRMATDAWADGRPFDPAWKAETESVSHREYGTGYFFHSPSESAQIVSDNLYLKDRAFLAVVHSFDAERHLAFCEQYNKMSVGETVNLLSPGTTGRDLVVDGLLNEDMEPIPDTRHPRMRFFMPVDCAKPGDIIRGK